MEDKIKKMEKELEERNRSFEESYESYSDKNDLSEFNNVYKEMEEGTDVAEEESTTTSENSSTDVNKQSSDKENKESIDSKKSYSAKDIIIMLLLLSLVGSNAFLIHSVLKMHAMTMQFISDVFYYTPPASSYYIEGDVPEIDVEVNEGETE